MATTSHASPRSSFAVFCCFLVAVLLLSYFNEPVLVSRIYQVSLTTSNKPRRHKPYDFPDFNRYLHTRTLSEDEFHLERPEDRVIVVGDTHGMNRSLHNLLDTLSYNPDSDTLFLVGDILAKSTEAGSLAILDFLSQPAPHSKSRRPIYAVRGNHDQMVVQWRAWRDWFEPLQLTFPSPHLVPQQERLAFASLFSDAALPSTTTTAATTTSTYNAGPPVGSGSQFLSLIESEWLRDREADPNGASADAMEWADTMRKRAAGTWRAEWWRRIPKPGKGHLAKDFIMFGDHYWLARDMSAAHAKFLYSLPLVIHVPREHMFFVHAGLLPSDPRRSPTDPKQPLAHLPNSTAPGYKAEEDYQFSTIPIQARPSQAVWLHSPNDDTEALRVAQEHSLLEEVPQNRDPWVVLNMRGVRKSGKITRQGDRGTPWGKIWNREMKRCGGFKKHHSLSSATAPEGDQDGASTSLPCYPASVVYGHAASRDLDVRRWTVGLDTGCLYGRRLTGLILQRHNHTAGTATPLPPADEDEEDEDGEDEDDEDGDEEEDEFGWDGSSAEVNVRHARVEGGSAVRRSRRPPTKWTRKIRFGDKGRDLGAKLVSIKCPKAADVA